MEKNTKKKINTLIEEGKSKKEAVNTVLGLSDTTKKVAKRASSRKKTSKK